MFFIKEKKNGFTLIELIGVLIILSIISLITLPAINSNIEQSQKDALKISANGLYNAGREYGVSHYDELQENGEKIFIISNGSFVDDRLNVRGQLPDNGEINILADGSTAVAINNGKWCAKRDFNDSKVTIGEDLDNCKVTSQYKEYPTTPESCFNFDSGTGTILGYYGNDERKGGPSCTKNIVVPDTIKGVAVTAIGAHAFEMDYSSAFGIESIYLPDSVTTIGDYAFDQQELAFLKLGNGVKTIGDYAFFNNNLTKVDFPNSLVSIGNHAFGSNLLRILILPNRITNIGAGAFNNNLLPDNQAFIYARNADGTIDNTNLVSYGGKKRGDEVVIPNNIEIIGDYAFYMYNWHFRHSDDILTSITIPDSVTYIGDYAFYYNRLFNLTLGNNVARIGKYAFCGEGEGGYIYNLVLPNSLTYIGDYAFDYQDIEGDLNLTNVTYIGKYAFYYSNITSVTIGNALTYIGDYAFYRNRIDSITLPNALKQIGDYAFYDNLLTTLIIPNGVVSIGDGAFADNTITNLTIASSVTTIEDYAFYYNNFNAIDGEITIKYNTINPANRFDNRKSTIGWSLANSINYVLEDADASCFVFNSTTHTIIDYYDYQYNDNNNSACPKDLTIPNTIDNIAVTTIGSNAFANSQLTSVIMPNGITTIAEDAFKNNFLTTIIIPSSVTTIGDRAFSNNNFGTVIIRYNSTNVANRFDNRKGIIGWENAMMNYINEDPIELCFDFDRSTRSIIGYYYYQNNNDSNPACPRDAIIPSTIDGVPVTKIGDYAFFDENLTSITIPNSVTTIGSGTFSYNQLTDINIPNSVTYIGDYAFSYNQLASINIPGNVNYIGEYAFGNNQLEETILSNGVSYIGYFAFANNRLTDINIPNSVKTIAGGAFNNNLFPDNKAFIYAHNNGTIDNTKLVSYAGSKRNNVVIPNNITIIGDYAFDNNQLTDISIPNNVTYIGDYAFSYNQLVSINIPDNVTYIGDYAFDNNQLTDINIPNSVTTIGSGTFSYNQLTGINIPDNVTYIGDYAFNNNQLTDINIPNSVTTIGSGAFSYNQLTSVNIPNNITTINSDVFANNQLTSINIPDNVTYIGDYAFNNNQLTSVNIPDNVKYIGYQSFKSNPLTNVSIGAGIITIEYSAFDNCHELLSIYIAKPRSYISYMYGYDISWGAVNANVICLGETVHQITGDNSNIAFPTQGIAGQNIYLVTKIAKSIASFKINNTLITGSSFVMPDSDVHITDVTFSNPYIIESAHPYTNNFSYTWSQTISGAKSIAVLFDQNTITEIGYDYIYIYDKDNYIGSYSGTTLSNKEFIVSGDTIRIKLYTDYSGTNWGFKAYVYRKS